MKPLGLKSASTNLRILFSAGKQWIPSSGWVSYWPPSEAAQLFGSCSWAWDEREDCYDCCGEEGAEPASKPFDLLVDLCSYLHLWARSWGSDRRNEIADMGGDVTFLHRVAGLSLRDRRRSFATREGGWGRTIAVKGASCDGSGIWSGCHLSASPGGYPSRSN